MSTIVFCLEEPSAWEMLQGILPKILPAGITARPLVFEGKTDLDKRLVRRVRGWRTPDTQFLILRDKDQSDCHTLKRELAEMVKAAGRPDSVIRIACHELEAFYLGDLAAVEKGLGIKNVAKWQEKQKYRTPDSCARAALELERLTNKIYQKIAGSRAIAPHLDLSGNNRSHSFNILVEGIRTIASRLEQNR